MRIDRLAQIGDDPHLRPRIMQRPEQFVERGPNLSRRDRILHRLQSPHIRARGHRISTQRRHVLRADPGGHRHAVRHVRVQLREQPRRLRHRNFLA